MSVAEVAERLGVKPATVYAYVSRGLLPRHTDPAGRSRFDPLDVERVARRGRAAANAGRGRADPVLVASAVTTVERGSFAYRGHDVPVLADRAGFEEVADLLWGVEAPASPGAWEVPAEAGDLARRAQAALPAAARPFDRVRAVVVALGAADPLRYDTSAPAVVTLARGLIATLASTLDVGSHPPASAAAPASTVAAALTRRLAGDAGEPAAGQEGLVDRALVLTADIGLTPSTVAARLAASVQADPYSVVVAGLGTLAGRQLGAACLGAEELLAEVARTGDAPAVLGARVRRGDRVPGFGHRDFPGGDPRAADLLPALRRVGDPAAVERIDAVVATMAARALPPPNVDFALAAVAHALGLAPGASEALIAVARCAGWVAHALEEYDRPSRFAIDAVELPFWRPRVGM